MTATGEPPPSPVLPEVRITEADAQRNGLQHFPYVAALGESPWSVVSPRAFVGTPRAAYPCGFGSDAYGLRWARLDSDIPASAPFLRGR